MNPSLINSMVTMHGLQQKLDVLANNMANLNTAGYKRKEATFEDILNNVKQQPQSFQKEGRLSPLGYTQGWGAKLSQVQTDLSQGTLNPTGLDTDLALEGGALFELQTPDGETAYTRNGAFELTVNPNDPTNVYLATKDGNYIKGVDNLPIKVPAGMKMVVDEGGVVTAFRESDPASGSVPVGQLKLVRVIRPAYLQEVGDNLYTVPAGLNNPPGSIVRDVNPASPLEEKVAVRQGYLEQSNVSLSDEMTELLTVQRAFQLTSRAVSSSDMMMNMANNLRG
ncbi:flagellar hook-basal body protein [Paenibacillus aurantius]|uniref:Flagellar hook-basal body protein n=1 Tax=Paenibacillus aurantius TaxID=2918900 RepID=A0AA96RFK6_9BACL|nr:flagellar hook-basal body protein [Paenibacillus aurantius]WNQ11576.1 flagellar hook-basal body protein [Paenibacillus aurantius]